MSKNSALKTAGLVGFLFLALVAGILYMAVVHIITGEMAMLMFVGMLGLYLGFGVLIAVFRFVSKLK